MNTYLSCYDTSQSPPVWTRVALVDDVSGPKIKRDTIDVTTHDTTNDYKQYIGSLKDAQEVTLTVVWDPNDVTHGGSGFTSLKQALEDGIVRQWKIVYPTSPSQRFTFNGFVVAYEPMAKVKDALRMNASIKVTDSATLSAGS
jgi:predicted secreted protein